MRILVLDDNKIEREEPTEGDIDYRYVEMVQTCKLQRFLELVYLHPWDEVWFDSDLGNEEYDGLSISKKLLEDFHFHNALPNTKLFRIITMNIVQRTKIIDNLIQIGCRCISTPIFLLKSSGIYRGDPIDY